MDSLIVLRKPLRGSSLVQKNMIPKKFKNTPFKVEPVPLGPDEYTVDANYEYRPSISFVRLYKELCLEKAKGAPRPHCNTPAQASATSLLTHYRGHCAGDYADSYQPADDSCPPSSARATLVLEFDYGTIFDDLSVS